MLCFLILVWVISVVMVDSILVSGAMMVILFLGMVVMLSVFGSPFVGIVRLLVTRFVMMEIIDLEMVAGVTVGVMSCVVMVLLTMWLVSFVMVFLFVVLIV